MASRANAPGGGFLIELLFNLYDDFENNTKMFYKRHGVAINHDKYTLNSARPSDNAILNANLK